MAGMEQLEIHSRSYLIRWVNVKAEHSISWSVQPIKKSINFGIFKHPGTDGGPTPKFPSSTIEAPSTPSLKAIDANLDGALPANPSSAVDKLTALGLRLVTWYGTCEPAQVSSGQYDVPSHEGGMYALVFDNTFAKSFSKTATFVLLTFPTSTPPATNHSVPHNQGTSSEALSAAKSKGSKFRSRLGNSDRRSSESTPLTTPLPDGMNGPPLQLPPAHDSTDRSLSSSFYTGTLQKRRRKRHQGFARRFFSLDYQTSTLSYYHDRNTHTIRGSIPLSLAAIGANAETREISIDSGVEIWHLRATSADDFDAWKNVLDTASRGAMLPQSPGTLRVDTQAVQNRRISMLRTNAEEEREWARVEGILGRITDTREAARSLAKDTDPKYLSPNISRTNLGSSPDMARLPEYSSAEVSPVEASTNEDDLRTERRVFWKRKGSSKPGTASKRSLSAQPTPSNLTNLPLHADRQASAVQPSLGAYIEDGVHDRCLSLLHDLEAVAADFSALLAQSKRRRMPVPLSTVSRQSLETNADEEFFDAQGDNASQLLTIQHESDEDGDRTERSFMTDLPGGSESDAASLERSRGGGANELFPPKAKNLAPLPLPPIQRRELVPIPLVSPPSLISFMRKNVGKDLSAISMPVSANEPISLLQRIAEGLEYSSLLDEAAQTNLSSTQRLLYVAAFAISSLSVLRVRERSLRKPFNPMLGETFELVREDKGFRFIAEKVSHRPVIMACQAEAEKWTLNQAPVPTQKFWGKSAELITDGRVRIAVHDTGDRFSWAPVTCFLRNIIAGEKYIEPVGSMTITNETTGEFAVIDFKAGGMFSGRSEDVIVKAFTAASDELSLGLVGKWTHSLSISEHGVAHSQPMWQVGALAPESSKRYGFTAFAAGINEVVERDRHRLPPTDSRWRPDQRAAEVGNISMAEQYKAKLEEGQRDRRRAADEGGAKWKPMWFNRLEGHEDEEVWLAKPGKESYWEHRARGDWKAVKNVLAV